nr:RNA-directed DNA polymerase, eukaryota, reverse transcriptase zinc-binding domain protein [Tanacetum cinerariifolium]GEZ86689.1 RNA-directed DNA polymerase, eukaryota, reverse transcriptase zinc-binding domain protein [Tanacetum cinerariifolium]
MKLVHVCFADDLLVMCHGDCDSVNVSKKALDEFSKCSELLSNNSKSTVFFGGLCVEDRQAILSVLPFAVGTLPVRDIYEARLKHDLTVGYMISNGQWLWPEDCMEEIRHKLLGLTIKDSKAVRDVEEKWKVSCIKPSRDSNGVFRLSDALSSKVVDLNNEDAAIAWCYILNDKEM